MPTFSMWVQDLMFGIQAVSSLWDLLNEWRCPVDWLNVLFWMESLLCMQCINEKKQPLNSIFGSKCVPSPQYNIGYT